MNKLFSSRTFRQGSVATAITVAVLAAVVVFNMLMTTLTDKYSLSLDLTEEKIFGISEDTKSFLKSLDKDISIYIMNTEQGFTDNEYKEYFTQANEVIKKYAQQSPRVSVQYIDLIKNPLFAQQFPNLSLNPNSIVIACGDKSVDLTPYDLYNTQTDMYYSTQIVSSRAEQAMTSAMLKVTSEKVTRAAVLTGHDETPVPGLTSILELNNYEVVEQNLMTGEIDPEATLAILCAPMRDLTDDELKRLDAFLENGGRMGKSLIYFASADQPDLPRLAAFLADWGIAVGGSVVFEADPNLVLDFNRLVPVVEYTEEVYSKTVQERNLYTLVAFARPLSALFESKSGVSVSTALEFSSTSGILPAGADENWNPAQSDISGPIPALIVAQSTSYEGTEALVSSVAACGSSLAVEQSLLSSPNLGNGEYFLSLINALANREETVSIQSKTIGGNAMTVPPQQIVILGALFVVLLPLAVLVFGMATWLGRRHR